MDPRQHPEAKLDAEVGLTGVSVPRRLRTADLHYDLPSDRIAIHPAHPRDAARLMVIDRSSRGAAAPVHAHVRDLPSLLRAGDLLILNQTRVLPARFLGVRDDTGGHVEGLYLGPGPRLGSGPESEPLAGTWLVLLKMKHQRAGLRVRLSDRSGAPSAFSLVLVDRAGPPPPGTSAGVSADAAEALASTGGAWIVRVESQQLQRVEDRLGSDIDVLEQVGWPPLPPYILAARKQQGETREQAMDFDEYQTVFATRATSTTIATDAARTNTSEPAAPRLAETESGSHDPTTEENATGLAPGSIAAPTAGLHFTPELLAALDAKGVQRAYVNLHVGLGTFKPVETEYVEDHPMHAEWCSVPRETAAAIARVREAQTHARSSPTHTRSNNGEQASAMPRIIAVGTTSARTLESFDSIDDLLARGESGRWTRLLITPGRRFRHVDALMTNFHLPGSTLMAMVGAFLEQPVGQPLEKPIELHDQAQVNRGLADTGPTPLPDGVARLKHAYQQAIEHGYRFYSFGDAMLIQ